MQTGPAKALNTQHDIECLRRKDSNEYKKCFTSEDADVCRVRARYGSAVGRVDERSHFDVVRSAAVKVLDLGRTDFPCNVCESAPRSCLVRHCEVGDRRQRSRGVVHKNGRVRLVHVCYQ